MTQPHDGTDTPPAALIAAGGVFLPSHLAEPIWRVLRAELARHTRDGGRVRPEVAQAVETLRAAAYAYVSAHGPGSGRGTDIPPQSTADRLMTTSAMATRLRVTERHARRIARTEGITPVARNLWHREDVAALQARRGV